MELCRSLVLRFFVILLGSFGIESAIAESGPGTSAGALDVLLQDYAFRAFVRPKTGLAYVGTVPANLTGISVSAMRLRSGSLRMRGVKGYNEFDLPRGVAVSPYVERLVLVYEDLGNWSSVYYQLPGYTYLTPVLGLLAYDASNLSATNLPKLELSTTGDPITIRFTMGKSPPMGSAAKCVSINSLGSVNMSDPISNNQCGSSSTGHFAIAVESIAPSHAPSYPINPLAGGVVPQNRKRRNSSGKMWIIIVSAAGGLALFMLVVSLALWAGKLKRRKEVERMEKEAESGEQLQMTSVGDTKAPAATVTRTQPRLEGEYGP
ncbi:hypothetical protein MLD38_032564 [Melastoma candidum]|uniref:Uncharacterized protein n=1 Tax=Melastoma candidum TaxID=119954 RepID=A0ACB9M6F5_9MYRT|nr:hypothetical protein MLD38_032564 [Melastoma candidum]